jgi:hypothetical protein
MIEDIENDFYIIVKLYQYKKLKINRSNINFKYNNKYSIKIIF